MLGTPGRLQRCNCGHVNNVVRLSAAREIGDRPHEALKNWSKRLRTAHALHQLIGDVARIQLRKN
jgi:hypothetical protein